MEDTYTELATYLVQLHKRDANRQLFIGIAGSPGSGKTTTAGEVSNRVNQQAEKDICVVLPMDGFHLYKRQLEQLPNAEEAFKRRGAQWTFDSKRFSLLLRSIKESGHGLAPSFDHKVGDPVEDDIRIDSAHRIILVEGNYLYLDLPEWHEVASLLDERWFIQADEDVAMERVVKRHMGTGNDESLARYRVEHNDRLNAREINATITSATRVIKSQDIHA